MLTNEVSHLKNTAQDVNVTQTVYVFASCPWEPATVNGMGLLTEMSLQEVFMASF